MSKERARRREIREAENVARAEARRAAEAKTARQRARKVSWQRRLGPLAPRTSSGQQSGILATRRRTRLRLILTALVFTQILTWIIRPDWPARLAAVVIAVIAFPVIAAFAL